MAMNIKTVTTSAILPPDPKNRVEGGVRTKGSTDRDGNGKREQKEAEVKRQLTDAEFDEAFKVLQDLPGLKANDLEVKVTVENGVRTVTIEDLNGKIIRRLSESQLWLATRDKDRQTGTILDKAM